MGLANTAVVIWFVAQTDIEGTGGPREYLGVARTRCTGGLRLVLRFPVLLSDAAPEIFDEGH